MFTMTEVAAAFGSGIFAAAIGGLPAFILCGLLVLANLPDMAFGAYFGPHISFAAGVGAAAFAGRKGLLAGSNDILTPLIKLNNGPVLLVGGVFGAAGLIVQKLFAGAALPTDTVALTVGLSGIAARVLFGKTGIIAPYKPDKSALLLLAVLGVGVGLISAYVTIVTKNVVLSFGVAAVSLILIQFMGSGPVTHHLALPAAIAASMTGNIWIGALFGLCGALLGDVVGKVFNSGDTHVDPPAITIATLTAIALVLLQ